MLSGLSSYGSRTFDWLVSEGNDILGNMSDSVNRGMYNILTSLAVAVSSDLGVDCRNLQDIDLALRGARTFRPIGKPYDLKQHQSLVDNIAKQAVDQVLNSIGGVPSFDNVLVVGGSAFLFKKAIKRAFPTAVFKDGTDSLYANVRGFQLLGHQYAQENVKWFVEQPAMAEKSEA
jgi:plasmid segregation protein ParM